MQNLCMLVLMFGKKREVLKKNTNQFSGKT